MGILPGRVGQVLWAAGRDWGWSRVRVKLIPTMSAGRAANIPIPLMMQPI